jgi:hypothetical protein
MSDAVFHARDLAVLAHARGFTLWLYQARSLRDVARAGFFDAAAGLVALGDMVVVSARDGGQVFQLATIPGLGQPGVTAVPLGASPG